MAKEQRGWDLLMLEGQPLRVVRAADFAGHTDLLGLDLTYSAAETLAERLCERMGVSYWQAA